MSKIEESKGVAVNPSTFTNLPAFSTLFNSFKNNLLVLVVGFRRFICVSSKIKIVGLFFTDLSNTEKPALSEAILVNPWNVAIVSPLIYKLWRLTSNNFSALSLARSKDLSILLETGAKTPI